VLSLEHLDPSIGKGIAGAAADNDVAVGGASTGPVLVLMLILSTIVIIMPMIYIGMMLL
jgi:hypothetical protein